ncbi:non-hydrolyzing UDP-N-acetylglucosamine 2-epimerase [Nitrosomonas communis]|uniref:UDP-N-acetylglucosamine 2-epimerase (non-hydrolyzing) n=1 Tax=Nitrosomonas communis TaxID=44574 RepID=A0A1I4NAM7_9PROT|nr:UDP-N-acetylglucosamine 2-epimerase (non-hydrolyzing) [Nitrosomonas communis]SFM12594.1 UDP-N-acetylglucosamine 2-epimerase (non-hydrolysing) [Nitrosomonas communis]
MVKKKIALIMGTRPEAIKMAPIVYALKQRSNDIDTVVIATAQHRQMLDQVLSLFNIVPDIDLDLMRPNQSLNDLTCSVLQLMQKTLEDVKLDLLMVQGDTTTVFAASVAAFYLKIPVAHVEAGLRSHDLYNPFPEEANRRLTSVLAQIHLAPTPLAKEKLLNEGANEENIFVTGNTVVDAMSTLLDVPFSFQGSPIENLPLSQHRVILVTSHRRESHGEDLKNTCLALKEIVQRFQDVMVIYPVHLNPNVRKTVMEILSDVERIALTEPVDYLCFLNLMRNAYLIVTDSGGVQEEAPTLKKPLLVLRKLTERPEAFNAGLSKIIGTSTQKIVDEISLLLTDDKAYQAMIGINPFGDGKASERIAELVCRWAKNQKPLLPSENEFKG